MIGEIYKSSQISNYQPSQDVQDLTKLVKSDYNVGYEILHKPWMELNSMSIIDRMNRDQRTFNAFVDESIENPEDAWKWRGTRSKARNKAMAMHAHLTANYIIPEVSAQNENDEEDQEMADVMHDIMEWMTEPGNSNYGSAFLMTAMGMLVNPVTYLSADYAEIQQTIKERGENGKITKKEVLDEVMSGFQAKVYSADQILITNAYEQNIQRQRRIIKRRFIDYKEAESKWKDHENWDYVLKGIKTIFNEDDGLFYDIKDENQNRNLVEEATVMGRRDDLEVCFVNGIYMGEVDIEGNPMKHRDNKNAPKYNVVPFGYHRVNEHFFYYKSLMNIQNWDNMLIDAMYEITMNRELLNLLMPVAVSGEDEVNSDVIFPGAVTAFKNKDTKITPLLQNTSGAGYNAMTAIEKSMDESSVDNVSAGQLPDKDQKAFNVAQASQNAKTMLGGVGKTLGESVVQYGALMMDIAINHLTIAQVGELGDMKYKSFILNNKTVRGKQTSKRIKFDASLVGAEMTDEEKSDYGMKILTEIGYPNHKEVLAIVNPELFARMKYLTKVDYEAMFQHNQEFQQAMMTQVYTLLRADPLIEPEALVRKLTYSFFRGDGDDLVKKNQGILSQINNTAPVEPAPNQAGQIAVDKGIRSGVNNKIPVQ